MCCVSLLLLYFRCWKEFNGPFERARDVHSLTSCVHFLVFSFFEDLFFKNEKMVKQMVVKILFFWDGNFVFSSLVAEEIDDDVAKGNYYSITIIGFP